MSVKAKLIIDGKEIKVLKYYLSFKQVTDVNGRVISIPVFEGLHLVIEAQKGVDLESWAIALNQAKQIELHIAPVLLGGKTTIYYFSDAHLVKLETNFSATGAQPMTETLLITSAGVKHSNSTARHEAYWLKTRPNTATVKPINYNELEKEPKITKIDWLDLETNEKTNEIGYDQNLGLQIAIKDAEGGTANITIKKKDGKEFETGKTTLTFTQAVNQDGTVEVPTFLVERIWEENKTEDYNHLIAKVTYNEVTKTSKKIKLVPFNQSLIVVGKQAQNNVKNHLPLGSQKYIEFDSNGKINAKLLAQGKVEFSNSGNFKRLLHLTNSKDTYIISSSDHYHAMDSDKGGLLVTYGFNNSDIKGDKTDKGIGVSLYNNKSTSATTTSIDENTHVVVSNLESNKQQAETTAHEIAHVYLFDMKKNHGSNIDPNHTVESIIENGELNIIRTTPKAVTAAKKEARKNYEKNNQ